MGGKAAGGGLGGGGPTRTAGAITPEMADVLNQTRRQNLFTSVGGLSYPRPGAGAGGGTTPPNPRPRPGTGPGTPSSPEARTPPRSPTPRPIPPGSPAVGPLGVTPPPVLSLSEPPARGPLGVTPPPVLSLSDAFAKPALAATPTREFTAGGTPEDQLRQAVMAMSPEERVRQYKIRHPGAFVGRTDLAISSGSKI